MPAHDPALTIDIADNRLDDPGYVRRWYPADPLLWRDCRATNMFAWPGQHIVTLQPQYPTRSTEARLSQWTAGGTNASYVQVTDSELGAGAAIYQRNPQAEDLTLTSLFTPGDNQPIWIDLYLMQVLSVAMWYADIQFCKRLLLRLLFNGSFELWRNMATGDDTADWRVVAGAKVGDELFRKHVRMLVYPSNTQALLIAAGGEQLFRYIDPEPVVTDELDEEGAVTNTVRCIAEGNPVSIYVAGGAWYLSYRYVTFPTTGSLLLPKQTLPWDYAGTWTADVEYSHPQPDDPSTVATEIRDVLGAEIASPPEATFREFWPYVEIASGDGERTPELYWSEMSIAPTTQVTVPVAPSPVTVGSGGRLRSLTVHDDMDASRRATIVLHDVDGLATLYGLADKLDMLTQVVTDGETVWKGYIHHVERPEQQSGDVVLQLDGDDTLSRLEVPLSDAYIGDGKTDIAWVAELFGFAGLAATDYVISATDPVTLPQAIDQEQALFQARDGRFIREMVEYLCKCWTGKDLYALRDGRIYYGPAVTTGLVAWEFYGEEPPAVPEPEGDGWETYWGEGIGFLKYYSATPARDESTFYNNIIVVGEAIDQSPIVAQWYNTASVRTPGSENYLGYEKLLLVVDTALRTAAQAEAALDYIVAFHGQPLQEVDLVCEFTAGLDVRDLCTVDGYGDGDGVPYLYQVRGCQRDWADGGRMHVRLRRLGIVDIEEE